MGEAMPGENGVPVSAADAGPSAKALHPLRTRSRLSRCSVPATGETPERH
jgi:hypothetical protein